MVRLVGIGVLVLIAIALLSVTPPPQGADETAPSVVQDRDTAVEAFVSEHISELSPSPAVLGGTYYVTEIHAKGGLGTVSYEDGHVAHTAEFSYQRLADGNISITSFVITH